MQAVGDDYSRSTEVVDATENVTARETQVKVLNRRIERHENLPAGYGTPQEL